MNMWAKKKLFRIGTLWNLLKHKNPCKYCDKKFKFQILIFSSFIGQLISKFLSPKIRTKTLTLLKFRLSEKHTKFEKIFLML
jgi:hypothetical protein